MQGIYERSDGRNSWDTTDASNNTAVAIEDDSILTVEEIEQIRNDNLTILDAVAAIEALRR